MQTNCGQLVDTNRDTCYSTSKNFQNIMKISTFFAVLVAQTLGKATFFAISINYLFFEGFLPGPAHDSALDYAFQVPGERNSHFGILKITFLVKKFNPMMTGGGHSSKRSSRITR